MFIIQWTLFITISIYLYLSQELRSIGYLRETVCVMIS